MRIRSVAGVLGAVVALSACGGPPPPGSGGGAYLEQGAWRLRAVDEISVPDEGDATPWLRVSPAEGRVEGSTGCNAFSGPYRAGGTTVAFGPLEATERGCTDPTDTEIERRMLAILRAADGYRIENDRLEVRVRGSIRMVFVAAG